MTTPENTSAPQPRREVPQYRLTEPAYIDDVLYDEAQVKAGLAVIYFNGIPGPHMLPLNAAAKEMVKQHKPQRIDPLAAFSVITSSPAAIPAGSTTGDPKP